VIGTETDARRIAQALGWHSVAAVGSGRSRAGRIKLGTRRNGIGG
jgi:hypothetical protein